jgi:hypothetical protein
MSPKTEAAPPAIRAGTKPVRDRRGFWRILLAIVVLLPMSAKAAYYMLTPVAGDVTFKESVASFEAHRDVLGGEDAVCRGLYGGSGSYAATSAGEEVDAWRWGIIAQCIRSWRRWPITSWSGHRYNWW